MPKSPKPKDQPTSVIIPLQIHAKLKAEAAKNDETVSRLIRRILHMWFDFQQKNKGDLDPEKAK
jgi:hypothetical protein